MLQSSMHFYFNTIICRKEAAENDVVPVGLQFDTCDLNDSVDEVTTHKPRSFWMDTESLHVDWRCKPCKCFRCCFVGCVMPLSLLSYRRRNGGWRNLFMYVVGNEVWFSGLWKCSPHLSVFVFWAETISHLPSFCHPTEKHTNIHTNSA